MFSVHFCLHIDLTITAAQKSPEKQERKNGQDISSADTLRDKKKFANAWLVIQLQSNNTRW